VVHAQAVKLSWTEVGYREPPSDTPAFAVPAASGSKRQRPTASGSVSDSVASDGRYHRGLRLDGSQCLAALDGAAVHAGADQLGSAYDGPPKLQHPAGVANGIPADAARQVLAGLVLELVDEDSKAEHGSHAVAGVLRRGDSMRWLATLQSAYLAGLDPGADVLGRAGRRVPGGAAFEYSMAAGATRALPSGSKCVPWKLSIWFWSP